MDTRTTLIDGVWTALERRREVTSPGTGEVVGSVCWGTADDARRAADAAAAAFESWAGMPGRARADILLRAADLLAERRDGIARMLAAEAGKRLPEAVGELTFSAEYVRWFAEEVRRPQGSVYAQEDPARRHLSIRSAAGVVVSLTSWNFPCSLQARKLAPALAAGCPVVVRASERAPLAVTEMIRAFTDAGVPAGVLGLVHGPSREITDALLEHPAVRVVTFTGSTAVGRAIMAKAAERVVRPMLELGGDAGFVVFDDADVDEAVEAALLAKTRNTGQSCVAANRFIVHEDVHDEFVAKLAARLDALTIGDGLADPVPDLGPMIDAKGVLAVNEIVADALARGAHEATAPREVPSGGTFAKPALFTHVPDDARMAREEVFGPVAGVFPFRTEDEAIARANGTEMGLAAYVFSKDASRCWRVAERLQAGIVGINDPLPSVAFAPMGGVKQSGLGREGSTIGLEEFTEPKYLAWRL
ncbi:NAD-dependent succinate-semialdehyde dehydrogenase [uncultured Microbacterium sp.]|uniref:NAD-dependent succinate-semialdehyde dehydrogenase n=1 Tax=uncultured Microbacterium sp. TaxID=191216 RepID=UPI002620ED0C|nr:NAD-dependent succinate-semialdehyde dehydrogenase [uncultured Microbacterium sp.]